MNTNNMKQRLYFIFNAVFISFAIIAVVLFSKHNSFTISYKIIIAILIFILIHVIKLIRQYLILLEEKIALKKYIKIYIKTTFTSVALPYKMGELFKIYSYGYEIKNYKKGLLAVLIDKFFDAILLITVFIAYYFISGQSLSLVAFLLLLFVFITIIIYSTFNSTYYYLNKYLILNKPSKKTIYLLNVLEKIQEVFKWLKSMIKGRTFLLGMLTILAWLCEYIFIIIFSDMLNIKFNISDFISYINDAFYGLNNAILNQYVYVSAIVFMVITLFIYFMKYIRKGVK